MKSAISRAPITASTGLSDSAQIVRGASNLTTVNAVPYVSASGVLTQDASNFFWDATNHRLGIGTNSPSTNLHISGSTPYLRISDISSPTADVKLGVASGTYAGIWLGQSSPSVSNYAFLNDPGVANIFNAPTGQSLLFRINNGTTVSIKSGSVGIGGNNTSHTGTLHVYDATASTGVTTLTVKAGAGQSSTNLQEWQNSSGTVIAKTDASGIITGAAIVSNDYVGLLRLNFSGQGVFRSQSDGVFSMQNAALSDFNRLQFGGTTSSFPALKRSTTGLIARLADDSADTWLKVKSVITGALTVATLPAAPTAGERAFVTDSNAVSFTAGIGAVVASGGSTAVPVVYDGTSWRIG